MKILILGSGNAQIDAIKFCRDTEGLCTSICSNSENFINYDQRVKFEKIDILNVDEIKKYTKRNQIDIVYSVGSDIAMPVVYFVSKKLGLPYFEGLESAVTCQNKLLLRQALGSDFPGNIQHTSIKEPSDIATWKHYPCIMKPSDSQGQRGVYKLNSRNDFYKYYVKSLCHSRNGQIIVEQYINGPEISVHAYIVAGEIRFFQATDRIAFSEFHGGLIKEHRIPSTSIKDESQIYSLVEETIKNYP